MPDACNLKEVRIILDHVSATFSSYSAGSTEETAWQMVLSQRKLPITVARKQRVKEGAREGHTPAGHVPRD